PPQLQRLRREDRARPLGHQPRGAPVALSRKAHSLTLEVLPAGRNGTPSVSERAEDRQGQQWSTQAWSALGDCVAWVLFSEDWFGSRPHAENRPCRIRIHAQRVSHRAR